jgi:2',3'-cyclic-nucleotide 2'-phosphodiesterase (5'-nucleotidase family)
MEAAAPKADLALFNSGSIRVDDILQLPVTQYDIIRAMPFGGGIREIEMKGRLLEKVLTAGVKNKGNGGFLQYSSALTHNEASGGWSLSGKPIEAEQVYRVALSDFLLTGKETGLAFLNEKNEDVTKVYPATTERAAPLGDIRLAVVRYAQKK